MSCEFAWPVHLGDAMVTFMAFVWNTKGVSLPATAVSGQANADEGTGRQPIPSIGSSRHSSLQG